jgi:hypothetical protein
MKTVWRYLQFKVLDWSDGLFLFLIFFDYSRFPRFFRASPDKHRSGAACAGEGENAVSRRRRHEFEEWT